MTDLHNIQMLILRELLYNPNSSFSQLNIQGLTSDHFSYHINTLLEMKLVTKKNLKYSLTSKGKEYANQMDTDEILIEKQPKIGVMVVAIEGKGEGMKILLQERTKEPFYGYKGFITGKVRFGEKIFETAKRELEEESGLSCLEFHLKKIIRNHVRLQETGELLEDKIFYIVTAINPKGDIVNTRNGKNQWVTVEEFHNTLKKYYDEENIFKYSQLKEDIIFNEETFFVDEF